MSAPAFLSIGTNATRVFGLTPEARARRFAAKAGLRPGAEGEGAVLIASTDFAWDPSWLRILRTRPNTAVTWGGRPALAHSPDPATTAALSAAMRDGGPAPASMATIAAEEGATFYNDQLRKRETAYLMPLTPDTARAAEKASYDGAYKGVTDLLTAYLWRGLALHLTRWAAAAGISPNAVTAVGAIACVAAAVLFWHGWLWTGLAVGFVFMVLDTVDGKLARCTGTSSPIGNVADHGIDLVHPPFWYWAWGVGLAAWGTPIGRDALWTILAVIVVGYVVQRLVEGVFMRRFGGIHIHVWEPIDSRFRLITARRNPNVVILIACLLFGRPDLGLIAVAWWTALSCVFHIVRLGQAMVAAARGREVRSWLA